MRDDILDVDFRSDGCDRVMILLHMRRDKILVLHMQSNGHNLMIMIRIQPFHLSR